mmetsp:Transcript_120076/g.285258  ORF Transcript_120076/g.285258 Transcript_120076/m.285258 type:complete len:206 (-) Transcript_120076:298-915(-)
MNDPHLCDQLINLRLIQQLCCLGAALSVCSGAVDDHSAYGIALKDRVSNGDDVLPALLRIAGVETCDLLLEGHLLPLLGGHLVHLHSPSGLVQAVGCVETGQGPARRRPTSLVGCFTGHSIENRSCINHLDLRYNRHQSWEKIPARGFHPRLHSIRHNNDLAHLHRKLQGGLYMPLQFPQGPLVLLIWRAGLEEAQSWAILSYPI